LEAKLNRGTLTSRNIAEFFARPVSRSPIIRIVLQMPIALRRPSLSGRTKFKKNAETPPDNV
jgi:hypothetical protein